MIDKLKAHSEKLKQEIGALYIAYRRDDVPWYAKGWLILVIGYALSPIDLIPDFIPVLGYLDDLLLLPLGLMLAIYLVPQPVMQECRREAEGLFRNGKPRNWTAAVLIIGIWVITGLFILIKVLL